jgi:dihydroflavonol-4-reductase
MRALVTGGCGFIGQHLVHALLAAGHEVAVLDPASGEALPAAAQHIRGSVLDETALAAAIASAEWVFHLAARAHLWIRDKSDYRRVNVEGTRLVLAAAQQAGVRRLVHTSTEAVLAGTADSQGQIDGLRDPVLAGQPGPYSRSKCEAELLALAAARAGLPVVVASPTAPLGPGDRGLTAPTQMLLDFLNGRHPAYLDCLLNLVDVRDVAAGHLLAAERGRVGQRYLLAGHNLRLADLLARLEELSGRPMPRRRIPYWLAWTAAAVSEQIADRLTHRAPAASLNGVRLVRRPLAYSARMTEQELGWGKRPLDETLRDAIADFVARALLRSPAPSGTRGSRSSRSS